MGAGDARSPTTTWPTAGAATFDAGRFREVLGHFATGVTIVTAMEDGGPVGFTCQAFTSLSLDPPLVALAPGKSSTSWPRIAAAGTFCVNILAEDQEALGRDFAVSGGDKFTGVGWRPGANGAPVLDGVLAWVECALRAGPRRRRPRARAGPGAGHGGAPGAAPRLLPGRLRPLRAVGRAWPAGSHLDPVAVGD